MRLSELVSALTPTFFTQLALLIFVAVFVAIAWRYRRHTPELTAAAALPLADDAAPRARTEVRS
jgi:cbb3-type cytochrome oxidase subunit 3